MGGEEKCGITEKVFNEIMPKNFSNVSREHKLINSRIERASNNRSKEIYN